MKNPIFQKTSLFLLITMLLMSCGKNECTENSCAPGEDCINGDCVYIIPLCEACGTYNGLTSGTIDTNFGPQNFTDSPISIVSSEGYIAYDYNIQIDISSLLGSPTGTLVLEVPSSLINHKLLITNEEYNYQGIATIYVDGVIDLDEDFNEMTGNFQLTGDAIGDFTFQASRP